MLLLEEIVHIIPLGIEYDRAIIPFRGKKSFRPNRVYILTIPRSSDAPAEIVKDHFEKAERVKAFLQEKNVEVIIIDTKLIDLLDVMKKISNIVRKETDLGNKVYINLSSAGRLTSIGAALAGMSFKVTRYYVKPSRYSKTPEERKKYGLTICKKRDIDFIENFEIERPSDLGLKVLVEIYKNGKMRSTDLIQFLFFKDYKRIRRSEKSRLSMKLKRTVMDKLESSGYVIKTKIGRDNEYELTKSGEYMANLCGLIPIDLDEIHKN